jgi:hypothetical protein
LFHVCPLLRGDLGIRYSRSGVRPIRPLRLDLWALPFPFAFAFAPDPSPLALARVLSGWRNGFLVAGVRGSGSLFSTTHWLRPRRRGARYSTLQLAKSLCCLSQSNQHRAVDPGTDSSHQPPPSSNIIKDLPQNNSFASKSPISQKTREILILIRLTSAPSTRSPVFARPGFPIPPETSAVSPSLHAAFGWQVPVSLRFPSFRATACPSLLRFPRAVEDQEVGASPRPYKARLCPSLLLWS